MIDKILSKFHVIMHETTHPGNIGSATRALKTMGLNHLILSNPQTNFPDPVADSLASGAIDLLEQAVIYSDLDSALAPHQITVALTARPRNISPNVYDLRSGARLLVEYAQQDLSIGIVFGPERAGLTNEDISKCQNIIHIPTSEIYSALNVASAIQLLTYELRMASLECVDKKNNSELVINKSTSNNYSLELSPAKHQDMMHFYQHLEDTLTHINFIKTHHSNKIMPKLRKLFSRIIPNNEEINILRGILTAINQKTGHFHPKNQESKK